MIEIVVALVVVFIAGALVGLCVARMREVE